MEEQHEGTTTEYTNMPTTASTGEETTENNNRPNGVKPTAGHPQVNQKLIGLHFLRKSSQI